MSGDLRLPLIAKFRRSVFGASIYFCLGYRISTAAHLVRFIYFVLDKMKRFEAVQPRVATPRQCKFAVGRIPGVHDNKPRYSFLPIKATKITFPVLYLQVFRKPTSLQHCIFSRSRKSKGKNAGNTKRK